MTSDKFEQPGAGERAAMPDYEVGGAVSEHLPNATPTTDSPPGRKGRGLKITVAILAISAAFAGGFFAGSYFPLKSDGDTSSDTTAGKPSRFTFRLEDYGEGECAPVEGAAERVLSFDEAPDLCIDTAASYTAVFDTSMGTVRVALDAANTPGTVNNFVNLARFGYYNGTLIHRSDPSIGILQGGSPHTNNASDPGPGYEIYDEGSGFTYRPGQLVMARRTAVPNSANAQYFFTVTESAALLNDDGSFVVFGEVIEGLDVLNDILDTHLDEPGNNFGGAPNPPVTVNTITIQNQPTTTESNDTPEEDQGG